MSQYYCTNCGWEGSKQQSDHLTLKQLEEYNMPSNWHGQICPNCHSLFSIIDSNKIKKQVINNSVKIKFGFKSRTIEIEEEQDLNLPDTQDYNQLKYINLKLNNEFDDWLSGIFDKDTHLLENEKVINNV